MEKTYTTYVEDLGDTLIIIRHVPCYKCEKCGETAYTGDVIERLEEIAAEVKKTLTEIAIVNYSAA